MGEVHNYEYLFRADALDGDTEGRKARPVLVIAADPTSRRVGVVPVFTKDEAGGMRSIAVPAAVGRAMGLPRPDESVLIVDEANIFEWTGYDLRLVPGADSSRFGRALVSPRRCATVFSALRRRSRRDDECRSRQDFLRRGLVRRPVSSASSGFNGKERA